MGRESSSIALLQERFRQLQRAKEMREEREHQRGFAASEHRSRGGHGEQRAQWFLHPELVRPSRPLHGPGALLVEFAAEHAGFPACSTAVSVGLWPERPVVHGKSSSDAMEVDTSLHL